LDFVAPALGARYKWEMAWALIAALGVAALVLLTGRGALGATLEPHAEVQGVDVVTAKVRAQGAAWRITAWEELDRTPVSPGHYEVHLAVDADREEALQLPHCAGRERVTVDGHDVLAPPGPLVVPVSQGAHDVLIAVSVSAYERRIACGDFPRIGATFRSLDGLGALTFPSPSSAKGGGRAVVYVPPHHDLRTPAPLLVGLHPWNGSMWTYAAYAQLLREARARDVILVLPSGLGNSLYVADAEDEVMRAIAAVSEVLAVDARAVSLWGASMGGAGATTIGFHHPDRFATITSFFGDARYDLTTYVHAILPNDAAAHRVNALDVVDNARHLPVWLIHGEADQTSPIRQSEILADAMRARGMHVRLDRIPNVGHAGALIARFLPEVVATAASSRVPENVMRVTYRSVRASDTRAYGVQIIRAAPTGDGFVDIERRDDAVHVQSAEGVRAVVLSPGALGTSPEHPPPIVVDPAGAGIEARWDP
jgi:pimeloyl-ACP methyl ester carboxylesterase